MKINIAVSNICTAFDEKTVGTKVTIAQPVFLEFLMMAMEAFERSGSLVGQLFIPLPSQIWHALRCGVAKMETVRFLRSWMNFDLKQNTHVIDWRGIPQVFAHPRCAAAIDFCAAVIYDRSTYNSDPDVVRESRQVDESFTHVLVALIATAGQKAPFPPNTLIHNIAGGNTAFIPETSMKNDGAVVMEGGHPHNDLHLLHKIIDHAKATEAYAKEWMVVADPL